jgi:hypothetical protein
MGSRRTGKAQDKQEEVPPLVSSLPLPDPRFSLNRQGPQPVPAGSVRRAKLGVVRLLAVGHAAGPGVD